MNDLLHRIAQLERILTLADLIAVTRGDDMTAHDARHTAGMEIANIVGTEIGALRYELRQFEATAPDADATDEMTETDFIAEGWSFPGHRAETRLSNRVAVTVFERAA